MKGLMIAKIRLASSKKVCSSKMCGNVPQTCGKQITVSSRQYHAAPLAASAWPLLLQARDKKLLMSLRPRLSQARGCACRKRAAMLADT